MLSCVLIGAGDRGRVYTDRLFEKGYASINAVVDPNRERLQSAGKAFGIEDDRLFSKQEDLWSLGKIADFAVISTLDQGHFSPAMKALDLGYDLLLEKPIASTPEQCIAIEKKAENLGRKVVVCHVLRYSPFFREIKKILDEGSLGAIVDISHNENIGNFHFAHSYVRGNWRKVETTSPLILAKSCHDLDILLWLSGKKPLSVSCFGSLSFFNEKHAPSGATKRCVTCPFKVSCRFSAYKVYLPMIGQWPATVISDVQTEKGLIKAIEEGPYGRCVFACDNDTVDHEIANFAFEGGLTISFNMSAFTDEVSRTIKIMCENGEIRGNEISNVIEVRSFSSGPFSSREYRTIHPVIESGGHNGSDHMFVDDFVKVFSGDGKSLSEIHASVLSHMIAFASEKSRLSGETVFISDYLASFGI